MAHLDDDLLFAIACDITELKQAEDILRGGVGTGDGEGTEEAVAISLGALGAYVGDFTGGGMDLVIVVPVDFGVEGSADVLASGQVVVDTGAHKAILEPAKRSLDLALGLRG